MGGGGGGFLTNGTGRAYQEGQSYQSGCLGGTAGSGEGKTGGFGGGGSTYHHNHQDGAGGGGYSGGGGSENGNGPSGAGGSLNTGSNQKNIAGIGGSHGLVRIYRAEGVTPTMPKINLLNSSFIM